jgi:hypothetical protein
MSALDDLIAEIKSPKYQAHAAAGTTAGDVLHDHPSLAPLVKATELDDTFEQMLESVAGLFHRLQTADGELVLVHDEAIKIARRTDMDAKNRVLTLFHFFLMIEQEYPGLLADAGANASANKRRLQ